jgi:hypothetical protein
MYFKGMEYEDVNWIHSHQHKNLWGGCCEYVCMGFIRGEEFLDHLNDRQCLGICSIELAIAAIMFLFLLSEVIFIT